MRVAKFALFVGILAVTACALPDEQSSSTKRTHVAVPEVRFKEQKYADLEAVIPGFGGYYADRDNIVVWLVDLSQRDHASDILQDRLQRLLSSPFIDRTTGEVFERNTSFRHAGYSFLELNEWRNRLFSPVLRTGGMASMGIDLRENAIHIGVLDDGIRQAVYAIAEDLSVPDDALRVVLEDHPLLDTHTLSSQFNGQAPPGVAIEVVHSGGFITSPCTLGFAANTATSTGFFTNSHCTENRFQDDNNTVRQPDISGNRLGEEAEDPPSFSCFFGGAIFPCGFSDAARFEHDVASDATVEFGKIVRTEHSSGSKVVDHLNPTFNIVGEWTETVGLEVDKIGAATGWTYGTLESTCMDVPVEYDGVFVVMQCQSVATYHSAASDSGAPVFRFNFTSDVELAGLHWGRRTDGKRFYSSVENIHVDFSEVFTTF